MARSERVARLFEVTFKGLSSDYGRGPDRRKFIVAPALNHAADWVAESAGKDRVTGIRDLGPVTVTSTTFLGDF